MRFWACVLMYEDAGGNAPFTELAWFAIKTLTMPISNADVERVFSVLALLKTKQHNRLQVETLEALFRLRIHLKVKCPILFFCICVQIANFLLIIFSPIYCRSNVYVVQHSSPQPACWGDLTLLCTDPFMRMTVRPLRQMTPISRIWRMKITTMLLH